jgi:S1-C subfamily serine protease
MNEDLTSPHQNLLPPPPPGSLPVGSSTLSLDAQSSENLRTDLISLAETRRSERSRARTTLYLLFVLVAALGSGIGGVWVGSQIFSQDSVQSSSETVSQSPLDVAPPRTGDSADGLGNTGGSGGAPADQSDAQGLNVAEVAARVAPTVVSVSVDLGNRGGAAGSVGTGILITSDGQILTNAHVVDGAVAIRVRLAGETEPRPATLLSSDLGNDLALLQIEGSGLPTARFADPEGIGIGDEVVAIGFALDLDGEATVTRGIISAVERTISTRFGVLNDLIQTDAAVSSGNSGGPLLNSAGEVVGVVTAVARGSENTAASNISFAISTRETLRVIGELRLRSDGSTRVEGYLGVGLADRTDGGRGAVITEVQPGSPAAQAGFQTGDVVVAVQGSPINGSLGLIAAIRDRSPGDVVQVEVLRDGSRTILTSTLEVRPDS